MWRLEGGETHGETFEERFEILVGKIEGHIAYESRVGRSTGKREILAGRECSATVTYTEYKSDIHIYKTSRATHHEKRGSRHDHRCARHRRRQRLLRFSLKTL